MSVPEKKRYILLRDIPEHKHRKLRLLKAVFGKTWNELLVDFFIALNDTLQEKGKNAMMKHAYEELQKAIEKRK